MQLKAEQLSAQLNKSLAPVYIIGGDEPLLVDECSAAVRTTAHQAGFTERQVYTAERGFDWNTINLAMQSLSLFSEKRLIEIRLPSGRPGDAGAKALAEFANTQVEDTFILIIAGRFDKQIRASKWVKALDKVGIIVTVYPLAPKALPDWVAQRLQAQGLSVGPGVVDILAYHFEGNLLALAQEIEKLKMLYPDSRIEQSDLQDILNDQARFNVFGLVDACLQADVSGVRRILGSLQAEGVEPALILWALARESRNMAAIIGRLAAGETEARVFQAYQVWPSRRPLVKRALSNSRPGQWLFLLRRAARADKILKGRQRGDIWHELHCLGLALCGKRQVTCQAI